MSKKVVIVHAIIALISSLRPGSYALWSLEPELEGHGGLDVGCPSGRINVGFCPKSLVPTFYQRSMFQPINRIIITVLQRFFQPDDSDS